MLLVVAYVRRVEQLLIDVCTDFGVRTERVEGRSGAFRIDTQSGQVTRLAAGQFFANALENEDVGINCHTNRQYDTRNTRQRQSGIERR